MGEKARAHVVISGRVQGVFFRMETQRAAKNRGVYGWVKNRRDGKVEAVFEGDKKRVDAMIEWCWKGSPMAQVQNVEVVGEDYSGEFVDFSVTY